MPLSPEPDQLARCQLSRPQLAQSPQPAAEPGEAPAEPGLLSYASPSPRRIVLTGFMAAGKTTVGRLLAQRLGWPFHDADLEIEAATGLTVPEIFRIHGEPWFRELEHSTIRSLLAGEPMVLAMGGGAIEDPRTRALLLDSEPEHHGAPIHLVHLEATLETTLARCGPVHSAASTRPVLADLANLEKRYRDRQPLYRQAHQTIQVEGLDPAAIAEIIRLRLGLDCKV